MYNFKHILLLVAAFFIMLSGTACVQDNKPLEDTQLMVSLYIPGSTMTRTVTGTVNPLQEELKITSLQIWAFLSEDGSLISYKGLGSVANETGLPNATISRIGMPLSQEMFYHLSSSSDHKVDVYALANAASALTFPPSETTTRDALDQLIMEKFGGIIPTLEVPSSGLPMSGVIKNAVVSGGYPVLNISTVKLIRTVSKIRFAFCQQGLPATATDPAVIANDKCSIIGVSFDGTTGGKDCQIGASERIFTTQAIDLGDPKEYSPLSASFSGVPLIPNNKLSVVVDPEDLFFRSTGHESETSEQYETRLDAAIAKESQIGPIYIRETDKTISGTISYRTAADGPVQTAPFTMETGGFPRNHTWIVYACFIEETMKLRLNVVVLPWEWSTYNVDYTTGMVNVIRRFTVAETAVPTFKKVQTSDGFYDVSFWHHVKIDESIQENILLGDIIISSPVGGKLHCIPVPGNDSGDFLPDAFVVTPVKATIYPNYMNMENGRIEDCRIPIQIKCNLDAGTDEELEGNYIDLHFSVETPDGRFVDLGSESIDYYRFILKKDWNQ